MTASASIRSNCRCQENQYACLIACQITETRDAGDCYFGHEEMAACVDEAHQHGIRLCAHTPALESIRQCIDHGVDVIYHVPYIDEQCELLLLEITSGCEGMLTVHLQR